MTTSNYLVWLLFGLGATSLASGCKNKAAASDPKDASPPPVTVETAAVREVAVPKTLRLTGSLRGYREVDLAANAAGRVTATSVERGALIEKLAVVAKLDVRAAALSASEARVQVASAQVQEEQARKECARFEQLRAKNAITEFEYDRVMTQCRALPLTVEAASVRANLAAQNVGDGIIRAPFAGVVTERYVEVGQYVRQDSRVVSLVSVDPLRLEVTVPEAEVAKVQEGADVKFRVAAYPDRDFNGKIKFISGAVRSTTRDLVVEAMVENADRALKPGMFAEVDVVLGTVNVPGVPRTALVERDGQQHAFFVIDHQIEERVLALGPGAGELVGVQEGAKIGEKVVIRDVSKLSNGQHVR
jgi:RND family efflux transporter MFP subunit